MAWKLARPLGNESVMPFAMLIRKLVIHARELDKASR